MSAAPDPAVCPRCGEANACARAEDPEASDCWCRREPSPRTLLGRVPAPARDRACLCQRCLREAREAEPAAD